MSAPRWLDTVMLDDDARCVLCGTLQATSDPCHNRVCRWVGVKALIEQMGEALTIESVLGGEHQERCDCVTCKALAAYERGPNISPLTPGGS